MARNRTILNNKGIQKMTKTTVTRKPSAKVLEITQGTYYRKNNDQHPDDQLSIYLLTVVGRNTTSNDQLRPQFRWSLINTETGVAYRYDSETIEEAFCGQMSTFVQIESIRITAN